MSPPKPPRLSPGENAWITLRGSFAPFESRLVSARTQCVFRASRLVTPVGPLRFLLRGEQLEPGRDVSLTGYGVQHAHVGDLVVFEVHNTSNAPASLDVRVYGTAMRDVGSREERLGDVSTAGPSGRPHFVTPSVSEEEETKPSNLRPSFDREEDTKP